MRDITDKQIQYEISKVKATMPDVDIRFTITKLKTETIVTSKTDGRQDHDLILYVKDKACSIVRTVDEVQGTCPNCEDDRVFVLHSKDFEFQSARHAVQLYCLLLKVA